MPILHVVIIGRVSSKSEIALNRAMVSSWEVRNEKIESIYKQAFEAHYVLQPEDSVPTIQDKLDAISAAFTKADEDYKIAQAAVDEYKSHWTGQTQPGPRNTLDPEISYNLHWNVGLKTVRRNLMWNAIRNNGDFPADLTDDEDEIYSSCIVAPTIDSLCKKSILEEVKARREKDKKAEEAKLVKEAIEKIHDELQILGSALKEYKNHDEAKRVLDSLIVEQKVCNANIAKIVEQDFYDQKSAGDLQGENCIEESS